MKKLVLAAAVAMTILAPATTISYAQAAPTAAACAEVPGVTVDPIAEPLACLAYLATLSAADGQALFDSLSPAGQAQLRAVPGFDDLGLGAGPSAPPAAAAPTGTPNSLGSSGSAPSNPS